MTDASEKSKSTEKKEERADKYTQINREPADTALGWVGCAWERAD